jgi:hypothetical protein
LAEAVHVGIAPAEDGPSLDILVNDQRRDVYFDGSALRGVANVDR